MIVMKMRMIRRPHVVGVVDHQYLDWTMGRVAVVVVGGVVDDVASCMA